MQTRKTKLNFIFLLFIAAILASCSIESKIAKSYVKNESQPAVLIFLPEELYKNNLKSYAILNFDSTQQINEDSLLFYNSLFLQHVNDSLFIAQCKQSMISELKAYGLKVYEYEQLDEFQKFGDSSYVLNLAQMQLEEYLLKQEVEDFFDYSLYSTKVDLNAINLNSWFELSRYRVPNENYPVLYSSYYIFDEMEGEFYKPLNNIDMVYRYKVDSVEMSDIYKLAETAGKKYAINFYDYILNVYIQDHLPKNTNPTFYYHYNRRSKSLQTIYNDAFTEIDPENN